MNPLQIQAFCTTPSVTLHFSQQHVRHALLPSVVSIVQADGQELLQACTSEQWDLAEVLIVSGSTLEAQDKVHCAYNLVYPTCSCSSCLRGQVKCVATLLVFLFLKSIWYILYLATQCENCMFNNYNHDESPK